MGIPELVIAHGVSFGRTAFGLVTKPYETYRRIIEKGKLGELLFIAFLLALYFSLASLVKVSAFRPFLLTRQFIVLAFGAGSGALLSILLLSVFGKLLGAAVRVSSLVVAWGYTLIPTVLWFLMTSFLYVILPPPRTTSVAGVTFSLLFIIVSATLLWWKITLAYLTLRFGLRFDMGKSILFIGLSAPFLILWSVMMYTLGIFKVPFI